MKRKMISLLAANLALAFANAPAMAGVIDCATSVVPSSTLLCKGEVVTCVGTNQDDTITAR